MKLAVVVGGWHWPLHLFEKISEQASGADLFVVSHRSPELPIVRQEKREILRSAKVSMLSLLDNGLYARFPTIDGLRSLGWSYEEAPNTVGDWRFFNQWLECHAFRDYDVILNCHDDTLIRKSGVFDQLDGDWLILANGRYPEAPEAYVRGSFEFWKRSMLELLDGHIDLGEVRLTREGETETPYKSGLSALADWNDTGVPLRKFMAARGISDRIKYLSPHYRISPWVIEGERGFLHWNNGASWSFEAGLKEFGLELAA